MNTAFSNVLVFAKTISQHNDSGHCISYYPGFSSHSPMQIFITANIPATIHIPFSHRKIHSTIPEKNDLQNNRIDFKKLANDFICNLTQLSFLQNVFQITLYKVLIFILGYQQTVPASHFHLCPVISFHIFYVNQIPFVYTEKIRQARFPVS